MSITWTDRDGVEWKVRVSGPQAMAIPLDADVTEWPSHKPTIIFRGMDVGYGTEDPGWGPVEELTDAQLQELLGRTTYDRESG